MKIIIKTRQKSTTTTTFLDKIKLEECDDRSSSSNVDPSPQPKKISQSKKNLNKWNEKGKVIPTCVNDGCAKFVNIRHWANGIPSLKTECSRCSNARTKNKKIDGVTFHKKQICENKDGILGFTCPMDNERYHEFPSDCYHMDHLDGNHENNTPDNVKTFCATCHTRKGKESGDFNSFKSSSRIHKM